jgi:hypothetical protein
VEGLRSALLLDGMLVIGSVLALLRASDSRLSHPGIIYVGVHAYIVTLRGWAILNGAPTFLSIDLDSVAKAVLVADSFLVCAVLGWVTAGQTPQRKPQTPPAVDARIVGWVSLVAIPLGVMTQLMVGYVPGVGEGSAVVTTSYQVVAVLWPALALLALMYIRGLKPFFVIPFFAYIAILGLQGHSRFRVLIPVILLVLIYMDARGRRWPPTRFVAAGLIVAAVFIPLKQIGTDVRAGDADLSTVIEAVKSSTRDAAKGTSAEQSLLDQQGITVRLVDDSGHALLGRPYLALVTLPVPRPWWPDKPALNEYARDLSTPRFPLAEVGGVTGLPGDLYVNFHWWGVSLGAFIFGRATGRFFRRAYAAPFQSTARFGYLMLAACMVQIARDGLLSIVLFTVVNATPWLVIVLLSMRTDRKRAMPGKAAIKRSAR